MHVHSHFFALDAQGGDGGAVAGAAAAGGPTPAAAGASAADPGAAGTSAAPADGASGGATAGAGSLMARGGGSGHAGSGAAGADGGAGAAGDGAAGGELARIPEKYIVKREDGTVDHEATALKQAAGYAELARRMGAGEAPPKTPEDYAPKVPAGVKLDDLKADPLYTGFLKGAHSRGMTNAHVSYVLEAMAARESMRAPDPAAAEADLRKVWQTDEQLNAGLANSYRAAQAFGGQEYAKLEAKFGNDPDFIRLMARIGSELREDKPAAGVLSDMEQASLSSLMSSESYLNAKHPEHAATVAKVKAAYARLHPEQ